MVNPTSLTFRIPVRCTFLKYLHLFVVLLLKSDRVCKFSRLAMEHARSQSCKLCCYDQRFRTEARISTHIRNVSDTSGKASVDRSSHHKRLMSAMLHPMSVRQQACPQPPEEANIRYASIRQLICRHHFNALIYARHMAASFIPKK